MLWDEVFGGLDVSGNLVLERGERRERPILPEAFEEVNLDRPPVEALREIGEKVKLASAIAFGFRKRRPPPDVEEAVAPPATLDECMGEVDPIGGEEDPGVEVEVGSRIAEPSPDAFPADDAPLENRWAAEEIGRVADATLAEQTADSRAAHWRAGRGCRGHGLRSEPYFVAQRAQERDVPGPPASEPKSVSDDDLPRAQATDEDPLGERAGGEIPDLGEAGDLDPVDERPKELPSQLDWEEEGGSRMPDTRRPRWGLEDVGDRFAVGVPRATSDLLEDGPVPEVDAVERADGDDGACSHLAPFFRRA